MGSGKSTLLGEMSDLLSARGLDHAVVDLDALELVSPSAPTDLPSRQLAALWRQYAAASAERLILAGRSGPPRS